MLRLLFEEDEVGRRASRGRTRRARSGRRWLGPTEGETPGRAAGHAAAHGGGGRRELGRGPRAAVLRAVAERGRRFSDIGGRAAADIDDAVDGATAAAARLEDAAAVADALAWRPDALRALRAAQRAGRVYRGAPGTGAPRPAGPLDGRRVRRRFREAGAAWSGRSCRAPTSLFAGARWTSRTSSRTATRSRRSTTAGRRG